MSDSMAGPGAGALTGVRVLDLTEHMAGPFCTMILADMGAQVIKLERPGHGDSSRHMGDASERNPYFRYINRNKLGITLDFKDGARARAVPGAHRAHGRAGGELPPDRAAARGAGP